MQHIKYFVLLLILFSSSCIKPPYREDNIILDDNTSRVPLFPEYAQPEVDSSAFVINIPDATHDLNAVNQKVEGLNHLFTLPLEKGLVVSALAIDGKIFSLNEHGNLFCIDGQGESIWQKPIVGVNNYASLSYIAGTLVVSTGTTRLYGINPENGDLIWKKILKAPVHSGSALVGKERIAIITMDNTLYILNVRDGTLHSSFQGSSPLLKKVNSSPPIFHDNVILLPPIENELIAIDPKTGNKIWSRDLDSTYRESMFSKSADRLIYVNGVVIASNNAGKIEAFEIKSGEKKWEQNISFRGSPYIVGKVIFVLSKDNKLFALNHLGKIKWITPLEDKDWYRPLLINGSIWIFGSKGIAFEYNVETGEKINELSIPQGLSYNPLILDGKIYLFVQGKELIIMGEK